MARRGSGWVLIFAVPLALGAGGAAWSWFDADGPPPPYRVARADRGPIVASVSATGTVQPVTTVLVGSQLSGQVRELLADFNTEVRGGQTIARLDDDQLRARLAAARAEVAQAAAGLATARAQHDRLRAEFAAVESGIVAADAQTTRAQSQLEEAQRERERKRQLATRGAATMADVERADAAALQAQATRAATGAQADAARANRASAVAGLAVAQTQIAAAEAQLAQREALQRQVEVDLDRAEIKAPIDGVVIRRDVDVGQTVAASLQAPVLFTIAQDLRQVEIHVAVDEADVGRVRPGQEAQFTVPAHPAAQFRGEVLMTRLGAQTIQNVVTYVVVISAENRDQRLMPGMTATVRLITDRRDDALRVPNAALRWRPPGTGRGAEPAATTATDGAASGTGRGGASFGLEQLEATLTRELSLDAAQRATLAGIVDEAREQLRALRAAGLPPDQLRARLGAARQQTDRRVAAILKPEQQAAWEAWRARRGGGGAAQVLGRVHVVGPDGLPRAVQVRLGIGDGAVTEIAGEGIAAGTEVIVGGGPRAAPPQTAPAPGGGPRFGM
ncbi:MAG: efflux RND transporter periplasmic adaptor subunit [Rhodospirillales bacterium]|jgi:HlyD family secretion protein